MNIDTQLVFAVIILAVVAFLGGSDGVDVIMKRRL